MQPHAQLANSVPAAQLLQVYLAQLATTVLKAPSFNMIRLAALAPLPQRVLLQPHLVVHAQMEISVKKAVLHR